MPNQAVHGAILKCSAGASPCALCVFDPRVTGENKPAANIADHLPGVNVPGFSACSITLGPCAPALVTPWAPGSPNVLVRGLPAVRNIDKLNCMVGGVISIVSPGQATVIVN